MSENLGTSSNMVGIICPLGWNRVKWSAKNWGAGAAALLPLQYLRPWIFIGEDRNVCSPGPVVIEQFLGDPISDVRSFFCDVASSKVLSRFQFLVWHSNKSYSPTVTHDKCVTVNYFKVEVF